MYNFIQIGLVDTNFQIYNPYIDFWTCYYLNLSVNKIKCIIIL